MTYSNEHHEQWTLLSRSNTMATDTSTQAATSTPTPNPSPAIELTINAKPTAETSSSTEKKDSHGPDCTCGAAAPPAPPKLERNNTAETFFSEDEFVPRISRNRRRVYPIRRYSISPPRRERGLPDTIMVNSSAELLSKVGKYDGIADLPFPARSSVYLATFPFTDKDVKKWTWLLSRTVEDTFLNEPGNDDEDVYPSANRFRGRNRSPYYEPINANVDIPSVFVSRALDTAVVPEDSGHKVRYLLVVQNRGRPQGSKLLIAESRKAAGIMLYYEALSGNSVLFVGAVVHQGKKLGRNLVKVETLEEAVKVLEDGVVGVVC
ncbi:hypothetical protein K505DRAFT_32366 [Melanomma pulvis-pyrius CBS 109.77]|uniref:Uncharacterized protein n=1 Tax=Melanomma pulvis-pyrius CBS 109.77 TaxID=1314802 RepID=A0A6A6XWQ8_9PLEO|nr:hypothetical protein K505DRAFT_32366 [Melanomma pulvis-pyrius CBS 109.77]